MKPQLPQPIPPPPPRMRADRCSCYRQPGQEEDKVLCEYCKRQQPARDLTGCEWQQTERFEWVFGVKVRGIVRTEIASVRSSQVSWFVWNAGEKSGKKKLLSGAIEEAEKALGIIP